MGLLESIVAGIEELGREKDAEDDAALRKAAERLADKEQDWVKAQVADIISEARQLMISKDLSALIEGEKKIRDRLTKFGEEAFQRGARAASRMNVIST